MIQDIKHQVILIKGATDGLGKRVAVDLAAREATILLHGRSPEKGDAAIQQIRDTTGNQKLHYYNGEYFDGKHRSRANSQAYDKQARRQLRMLSEQLTHLRDL